MTLQVLIGMILIIFKLGNKASFFKFCHIDATISWQRFGNLIPASMKLSHKATETDPARHGKKDAYAELLDELLKLQQELLTLEAESAGIIRKVDVRHRASAANL